MVSMLSCTSIHQCVTPKTISRESESSLNMRSCKGPWLQMESRALSICIDCGKRRSVAVTQTSSAAWSIDAKQEEEAAKKNCCGEGGASGSSSFCRNTRNGVTVTLSWDFHVHY